MANADLHLQKNIRHVSSPTLHCVYTVSILFQKSIPEAVLCPTLDIQSGVMLMCVNDCEAYQAK